MLDRKGVSGGKLALSQQGFFVGINDPLGGNPEKLPFDNHVFNLFDAWENSDAEARAAVERGQKLFNLKRAFGDHYVYAGLGATLTVTARPKKEAEMR